MSLLCTSVIAKSQWLSTCPLSSTTDLSEPNLEDSFTVAVGPRSFNFIQECPPPYWLLVATGFYRSRLMGSTPAFAFLFLAYRLAFCRWKCFFFFFFVSRNSITDAKHSKLYFEGIKVEVFLWVFALKSMWAEFWDTFHWFAGSYSSKHFKIPFLARTKYHWIFPLYGNSIRAFAF